MRINELFEAIDQKEADELLRGLIATGDSVTARYFMQTRYDPRHTSIDSAQRAAERMAKRDLERDSNKPNQFKTDKPETPKASTVADKPAKKVDKAQDFEPASKDDGFDFGVVKNIKPFAKFAKGFKLGTELANRIIGK